MLLMPLMTHGSHMSCDVLHLLVAEDIRADSAGYSLTIATIVARLLAPPANPRASVGEVQVLVIASRSTRIFVKSFPCESEPQL